MMRSVSIRAPKGSAGILSVDSFAPARAGNGSLVYLHGFMSVRRSEKSDALATLAQKHGLGFARFDFRAHGDSTGVPMRDIILSGMLDDAHEVFASLPDLGPLYLIGSSIGALVALKLCATLPDRVLALLLVAPAGGLAARWATLPISNGCFTIKSSFVGDTDISEDFLADAHRNGWHDAPLAAGVGSTPVMAVHGALDDSVPLADAERLFSLLPEAAPKRWVCYPQGGHRLNENIGETYDAFHAFLVGNGVKGVQA